VGVEGDDESGETRRGGGQGVKTDNEVMSIRLIQKRRTHSRQKGTDEVCDGRESTPNDHSQ